MGVINKYESFSWQGWQRQDPVGALAYRHIPRQARSGEGVRRAGAAISARFNTLKLPSIQPSDTR